MQPIAGLPRAAREEGEIFMATFLQYLISGLSMGALYVLVALGIVLIYRSTRILNFAHGDMATMGTFFMFTLLALRLPFSLGFILSLLLGGLLAVVFYFVVIVPAQRRDATQLGQITLTVGLSMIMQGAILFFWGTDSKVLAFPLSDTMVWQVGPVYLNALSLGTLIVGIAGSLLFYLLIQKTRIGLAMRATSENLQAAQTLGIPTRMVLATSWGLAAILGQGLEGRRAQAGGQQGNAEHADGATGADTALHRPPPIAADGCPSRKSDFGCSDGSWRSYTRAPSR